MTWDNIQSSSEWLNKKQISIARQAAHAAFDQLWSNNQERSQAYRWLASKLEISLDECHISKFGVNQCNRVIDLSEKQMLLFGKFDIIDSTVSITLNSDDLDTHIDQLFKWAGKIKIDPKDIVLIAKDSIIEATYDTSLKETIHERDSEGDGQEGY